MPSGSETPAAMVMPTLSCETNPQGRGRPLCFTLTPNVRLIPLESLSCKHVHSPVSHRDLSGLSGGRIRPDPMVGFRWAVHLTPPDFQGGPTE